MILTEDEFQRRFTALYKSAYPIICVETHEEEWALGFFKDYVDAQIKDETPGIRKLQKIYMWSRAFGVNRKFKIGSNNSTDTAEEVLPGPTRNPFVMLSKIHKYVMWKGAPATMFIIRDLNDDLKNNDDVQRMLREIFFASEATKHVIILMQSDFVIPQTLEKELVLLDFATPTVEKRREFFNEYIKDTPSIENKLDEEQEAQLFANMSGLTVFESNHLLMEAAFEHEGVIDERILEYAKNKKKENIRKTKLLEILDSNIDLDDIGGLDRLKEHLLESAAAFTPKAKEFGIKPPKGVILLGPPGCGKTQIAKATANALNMPLIVWNIGALFGGLVGQSEANTRATIKQLEANAPAVVLLDEIEKYLGGMKNSTGDSGVGSRVLGTILSFMSDTTAGLYFVATANSIDLPPEILRKGRWDELFYVPLPNPKARRAIFRIHLKKIGRNPKDFDIKNLAKETKDYSGSEIEEALQAALRHAFYEGDDNINDVAILNAIKVTKPLAVTMKESLTRLEEFARDRARSASSSEEQKWTQEEIEESPFSKNKNKIRRISDDAEDDD